MDGPNFIADIPDEMPEGAAPEEGTEASEIRGELLEDEGTDRADDNPCITTQMHLFPFLSSVAELATEAHESGIEMAGSLNTILPFLIVYLILKRYIVEDVDQAGITGI